MKTKILAILLLAFSTTSFAEEYMYIGGAGSVSCGSWTQETPTNKSYKLQGEQWVEGFLTAHNYYSGPNVSPADSAAVTAYIDNYCRNNPLHHLFMAAAALAEELGGAKAAHKFKH